ncbi:hypothetical protein [Amycolatopsis taiwanensis]|uniref:hypothetical protein n=1 Tax=Amycolatopsis taiwanensis TaxID=342230 RepID=UPI000489C0D5|nr:hypothetical protein [Amycolatopsis taiwanensis]
MATIPVVSSSDGPKVTVNDFVKDPLRLPTLIVDMMKQGFIADAVLRSAGEVESGAVRYNESTPPYADTDSVIRGEFSEVPIAQTSVGAPKVAYAQERALGIMVSDRMRRRQVVDPVTRQLQQVKNTLVRNWADAFLNMLLSGAGNVVAGGSDWTNSTSATIRKDINAGKKAVNTAKTSQGASFGFEADVMIIGQNAAFDIMSDDTFQKPYQGNIADENLLYTGKLPYKIQGLNVLVTPELDSIDPHKVIIAQRGICGFIADEIPLQASAVYRVEEKKSWRSDVQRASAMGLDQPLAVAVVDLAGA